MLRTSLVVWSLVTMATMKTSQSHQAEVLYHSSVNFTCNSPSGRHLDLSTFPPGQLKRVWILPNDDLIEAWKTNEHERVEVLENGAVLHVKNVADEDFGWYYCLIHVLPVNTYLLQKHGLNVHGPYWGDLYELKYKSMITTGLVAGAICFVCTSLLCFFYSKQQARLDKQAEEEKAAAVTEENGKDVKQKEKPTATQEPVTQYVNEAFEANEEESERPQKAVTQHATIAYAEERGSRKGPAPGPPAQQELQNVVAAGGGSGGGAAAADGDAAAGGATKL